MSFASCLVAEPRPLHFAVKGDDRQSEQFIVFRERQFGAARSTEQRIYDRMMFPKLAFGRVILSCQTAGGDAGKGGEGKHRRKEIVGTDR